MHCDLFVQVGHTIFGSIEVRGYILICMRHTSVTRCANPSMGMTAMIRAYSLNLLPGMELGYQFNAVEFKMF